MEAIERNNRRRSLKIELSEFRHINQEKNPSKSQDLESMTRFILLNTYYVRKTSLHLSYISCIELLVFILANEVQIKFYCQS